MKKFALAGNPNCGKTTLFNALTGSTAHVGNWPGVTVDKKEGFYKRLDEEIQITDLPGIYSLSPYTPEEVISRNYILDEKPDAVINIVDATNLERNLYLTTQLLEMDVPVIIALNMMDIVKKSGDKIDAAKLEKQIGVPVVPISAQKEENIDLLMERSLAAARNGRVGASILEGSAINHLIKDVKAAFTGLEVAHPLFHAIKLIENDEIETKDHPELVKIVDEFKKTYSDEVFGNDLEAVVADSRYKFISKNYSNAKEKNTNSNELKASDKADKILTNKWLGIPIFLILLFLIYHLTFSTNFLFLKNACNFETDFNDGGFFSGLFYTVDGINSPGVILQTFLTSITDWIKDTLVAGWLEDSPAWISGFICDGVLAGVFSVLSFLPQILLLFLFFSILEDSGYMARVAFILDRIFRKFGLSGRAFMPMIMGFGCSVPAMINTRTLADQNERVATVRVIPFFSCGAKLPILTAVAGAIATIVNLSNPDLIAYSMYLIGIVTAIVAVILMRNTTMRGEVPPFIMELPAYHRPQFKALMLHLWDKAKHFVKKAFTIILASTIIIWFLQSFTWSWQYISQVSIKELVLEQAQLINPEYAEVVLTDGILEGFTAEQSNTIMQAALNQYNVIVSEPGYLSTQDSILAGIGQLFQPLFTPLGFGSQLGIEAGWVFVVAAMTGLIAKENVISTFAVLATCVGPVILSKALPADQLDTFIGLLESELDPEGASVYQMFLATGVTVPGLLSFIVFNMTTIPCFAAVGTAKAELPEGKFGTTLLFWIVTSCIVSAIIYIVGSWWWTIFIVLTLAVAAGFGIHYFNKYRDNKKILA